jgi:hypothetical protein
LPRRWFRPCTKPRTNDRELIDRRERLKHFQ